MDKNYSVLIAKGIAIIGVVAHHIANRRFPEPERGEIAMPGLILDRSVTMFFCASGYLRALSHARKPDAPFWPFITSRAQRLLILFAIIALAYPVVYTRLVSTGLLSDALGTPQPWWEKWFAMLTCSPGGVGEQLYFLPLLFLVTASSAGLLAALRNRVGWVFPLACVLIATAFLTPGFYELLPGRPISPWHRLAECVGIYLVGYTMAARPGWVAWLGGTAVAPAAVAWAAGRMDAFHCVFWIALFSAVLIPKVRFWPLETIGRASGTVYIHHTPFLIQPLPGVGATQAPHDWHVPLAFLSMAGVIVFLTAAHIFLLKGRLKWAAF
jgi:acyltransferase